MDLLHASTITDSASVVKGLANPGPSRCRFGNVKSAYRLAMADRLPVFDLPPWWLAEFESAVKERGLTNEQLVEMLVPERTPARERQAAIAKARVKVTRFRRGRVNQGDREPPAGATDTIAIFCERLSLDPFVFIAADSTEAAAFVLARKRPADFMRAAGRMVGEAAKPASAPTGNHPPGASPMQNLPATVPSPPGESDLEAQRTAVLTKVRRIPETSRNKAAGRPIAPTTYDDSSEPETRAVVPARSPGRRS
jgi:hypothetical protein